MPNTVTFKKSPRRPFAERLAAAIILQRRVIIALFLRETRTRFGFSLIGYTWTLLEPAFNLLVWALLFSALARPPILGDSMFLFTATGFFPFLLFRDISGHLLPAITANRSLLQFPIVHNLDVIIARALLEAVTFMAVCLLFFSIFWMFGLQAWPAHPVDMLACLLAIALLGFGVGTINAVLACLLLSWPKVYPWYSRAAYVACGVFFIPAQLPPELQTVLWYMPMTHAVEWFRLTYYEGHSSQFLSVEYLLAWGAGTTFTGLALERLLRRRISVER